jgi:GntR family transcriptional regulator, transcriptional repressor for pyruvate dehydrogenase complex
MSNLVGPPLAPTQRLTELVTERLLGLMRSGHLQEGSKLPPERELAELLGVSRTMVREALSALQLAGLVERRQGRGTVVVRTPARTVELDTYIQASASIAELIDARMAIELGVVHLLCEDRTYDLGEAIALLDAMRLAVHEEHKAERYLLPSLDFHLALARATERQMVVAIVENLIELMRPHLWLLAERYDLPLARKSLALHERMLAAIQARDVITALGQVKLHYAPYPVTTLTSSAGHRTEGSVDVGGSDETPSTSRLRGTRVEGSE